MGFGSVLAGISPVLGRFALEGDKREREKRERERERERKKEELGF